MKVFRRQVEWLRRKQREHAVARTKLFDRDWYLARYPDVMAAGVDPIAHYVGSGANEGRDPNPLFDSDWYLAQNPDVKARGVNPLLHYVRLGATTGRDPNPLFDSDWYLKQNPDVKAAGLNPLVHFLRWGWREWRRPCRKFDIVFYVSQLTPEERERMANPLIHYFSEGQARYLRINDRNYDVELDAASRDNFVHGFGNGRPTILMVLHAFGGGTARHVRDLVAICGDRANVLMMISRGNVVVELSSLAATAGVKLYFEVDSQWDLLLETVKACGTRRVHIHHWLGSETFLRRLIGDLSLPFDVTLHDHYVLAPQPFLVGRAGRFVGEDLAVAFAELSSAGYSPSRPTSLQEWQARSNWVLFDADRVIVPSNDMAKRLSRNIPDIGKVRLIVAAHWSRPTSPPTTRPLAAGAPLCVGLLNAGLSHKGAPVIARVAELALRKPGLVEFQLFGEVQDTLVEASLRASGVKLTGVYQAPELQRLVRASGLHVLWFPAQCPEAFSYALSEGLEAALPIVVANIGALPERVAGREWTWTMPWDMTPAEWLQFFLAIREANFATGKPPAVLRATNSLAAPSDMFYRGCYTEWIEAELGSTSPNAAKSVYHRLWR
jgi:glycosyltransferase involved in cell wall biosynthesis